MHHFTLEELVYSILSWFLVFGSNLLSLAVAQYERRITKFYTVVGILLSVFGVSNGSVVCVNVLIKM